MTKKLFKSEEEVNAFLGISPIGEPDLSWVQPQHQKAVLAAATLFNIHEAHNKANNWAADWSDDNQTKYNPGHWIEQDDSKPSGFGFASTAYGHWHTCTSVGSRLSVGSSEEAIHIAGTFEYLYQDLYFIPNTIKNEK